MHDFYYCFINCELEEDSFILLLIFSPSSPFPYSSHSPSPLSPALLAPEFCPINLGTFDPQDSYWILNSSSLTTGFWGLHLHPQYQRSLRCPLDIQSGIGVIQELTFQGSLFITARCLYALKHCFIYIFFL